MIGLMASFIISFICKTLIVRFYSLNKCQEDQRILTFRILGKEIMLSKKMLIRTIILHIDNVCFYFQFMLVLLMFMWGVLGESGVTINGKLISDLAINTSNLT